MKYRESEETYLETILVLKKKLSIVRSVDVATELNYSRPSVSRAVNLLLKKEYITIGKNGEINFTEAGYDRANEVQERHSVMTQVFIDLGASKEVAEENACRVEHVITKDLFEILKNSIKK
ncbi:MAG: metal-dependent transcriptional regulator [Clostridiales bacterium]|jgi:Mn-dependent DtxR family transcriptional regulator|nr:metal-dependent transcriptional regulator [Clostridiales bacterium]